MSEEAIKDLSLEETRDIVQSILNRLREYDLSEVEDIDKNYWKLCNREKTALIIVPKTRLIPGNPILYNNCNLFFESEDSVLQEKFLKAIANLQHYCSSKTRVLVPEQEPIVAMEKLFDPKMAEGTGRDYRNEEKALNNGGKTSYYDLPKPNRKKLEKLLIEFVQQVQTVQAISIPLWASKIEEICPQTLNDLIEFKKMEFWRGEILKADYGLEGRTQKLVGYDSLSAEERELNKIIYYAERRKAMIQLLKEDL